VGAATAAPTSNVGKREAEARARGLGSAEDYLLDRADRDDELLRLSAVREKGDEAEPGLRRDGGHRDQRPVREFDFDRGLGEAVLLRELGDAAVEPLDELVERSGRSWDPQFGHAE
jgi:hypothetical protein